MNHAEELVQRFVSAAGPFAGTRSNPPAAEDQVRVTAAGEAADARVYT